jgi:uncharacterized protein with HEPN domain
VRDSRTRLVDMLEAIERIERYAARGRRAFEDDELIQTWVIHHLQIIGEAAAKLDRDFHTTYPDIPWAAIVAMRNILVHDYFGVDLEEIWSVIERDLPGLKAALRALLDALGGEAL